MESKHAPINWHDQTIDKGICVETKRFKDTAFGALVANQQKIRQLSASFYVILAFVGKYLIWTIIKIKVQVCLHFGTIV